MEKDWFCALVKHVLVKIRCFWLDLVKAEKKRFCLQWLSIKKNTWVLKRYQESLNLTYWGCNLSRNQHSALKAVRNTTKMWKGAIGTVQIHMNIETSSHFNPSVFFRCLPFAATPIPCRFALSWALLLLHPSSFHRCMTFIGATLRRPRKNNEPFYRAIIYMSCNIFFLFCSFSIFKT